MSFRVRNHHLCQDLDSVKKKAERFLRQGYRVQVFQAIANKQNCYVVFAGVSMVDLKLEIMVFNSSVGTLFANITNDRELHDFFVDFYTVGQHNIRPTTRRSLQEVRSYIRHYAPSIYEYIDMLDWKRFPRIRLPDRPPIEF